MRQILFKAPFVCSLVAAALCASSALAHGSLHQSLDRYNMRCTGVDDTAALLGAVAAGKQGIIIQSDQTCASRNIIIPNLRIERGGALKPLDGQTITLTGEFEAPRTQVFLNAIDRRGAIAFDQAASVSNIYPQWWQSNLKPGTTDMTSAIQAALTSAQGRGTIFFPAGDYLITATLTLPETRGSYTPVVIDGDGPFVVSLINKAPASHPTLMVNRDGVTIRNIGFWGHAKFRNDGIQIYRAHRVFIQGCELVMNGNAITLQEAHSIFIQNNFGRLSGGAALQPAGSSTGWSFSPTDAFVYVNLAPGGFANHIVIRDNINEGYGFQIYTAGSAYGFSWLINGNQFEGSTNGLKINNINDYEISGNYLGEGGSGFAVDLDNCRHGRLGPNYIHFEGFDSKTSTVRLQNVYNTTLMGSFTRLYLSGNCPGLTAEGTGIERLQDETSDHTLSIVNSGIGDVGGIPMATLNWQVGRATWYSDSTEIVAYPTARLGDRILKRTPTSSGSTGWICTRASSTGTLNHEKGNGPSPEVLNDYAASEACDFRLTVLAGGPAGTATYKVEWKPAGRGQYADLTQSTITTELAHLVKRETNAGPIVSFSVRWPEGRIYVAGEQWTLTQVMAPVWTALP